MNVFNGAFAVLAALLFLGCTGNQSAGEAELTSPQHVSADSLKERVDQAEVDQVAPNQIEIDQADDKQVVCKSPRSEMCTMNYQPVCAQMDDGQQKEYANGCSACSNPAVQTWTDGVCPDKTPSTLK